jgi:hypothetical protein
VPVEAKLFCRAFFLYCASLEEKVYHSLGKIGEFHFPSPSLVVVLFGDTPERTISRLMFGRYTL